MTKKVLYTVFCIIILLGAGCNKGNVAAIDSNSSESQQNIPETSIEYEGNPQSPNEIPLTPAREITRGGEVYDYDGWILGGGWTDCPQYVNSNWVFGPTETGQGGVWTDPNNKNAKIEYIWILELIIPPEEAIKEDYKSEIEKGGDVEYGEFVSEFLSEAYYIRYIEDGYIFIELYAFYYPRDAELFEPQCIVSLSYRNCVDAEDSNALMTEADFWKVAQSMYIVKSYTIDGGNIPYIPGIDGYDMWTEMKY